MSELGSLVAKRRADLGLSLQQLADRAGLTKGHIWEIEKGMASNLRVDSVCGLAAAVQLSAVAVFRAACGMPEIGYRHAETSEE